MSKATPIGTSIGGESVSLEVKGRPVFVKKVPLTDKELLAENIRSTRNLFELPLYYQYGIGSAGFGAWRELAVHIVTTNWILTGQCPNFPLLYHWRVLPNPEVKLPSETLNDLENSVKFWEGSAAVRARLEAAQKSSTSLVLFLEHFPENLDRWFQSQMKHGGEQAQAACKMVEDSLKTITSFMSGQGLLHFDAHFRNILTDGNQLFFADFGLATCSHFELSQSEKDFFEIHRDYDQFYIRAHLTNWLVTSLFGSEKCDSILNEYYDGKEFRTIDPAISQIIRKYASVTIILNKFFRTLLTQTRVATFPRSELERAYKTCEKQRR